MCEEALSHFTLFIAALFGHFIDTYILRYRICKKGITMPTSQIVGRILRRSYRYNSFHTAYVELTLTKY